MMDGSDFVELATTPGAIALTVVVTVVYPIASYLRYRAMSRRPGPWSRERKLRLYASTIFIQWMLVFATVVLLSGAGGGLSDIGQRVGAAGATAAATCLLLGWFAVLTVITTRGLAKAKASELPEHIVRVGRFLPVDRVEGVGFVALAFTAGICEEILYRGWLTTHLRALGAGGAAFVLSAIVFGIAHAYQGRVGMIASGMLGLMLGGVVHWTGSLVPGQVLHVLVDLTNGFAIARALQRLRGAPGASIDASRAASVESES
jgi:membrane protease YdiL (CAAX protease family)